MLGANAEQSDTTSIGSFEAATSATIALAKIMCGDEANLDQTIIQTYSSAFAVLSAIYAITGDAPKSTIDRLIPAMYCDEGGVLHVDVELM